MSQNKCPQCSLDAQAHFHTMTEVGMQLTCEVGHKTTVIVKFNIAEVTFLDATTGRVFRHDKFREVKPQRTMAH